MLAAALWRHRRLGPLKNLQQRLLHTLTGDVASDGWVLRLAGDLVDLIDVYDAHLGTLGVEVRGLDQLEEDVLHVLTHVAGLSERGGIGDRERHVEHLGERLSEIGLTAAGRTEHQNVGLGQLHAVAAAERRAHPDPLVMVVDGHGQVPLGGVLPDHVLVEERMDLRRLGQLLERRSLGLVHLGLDDLVTQLDALVADVDPGTGDQLLDLLLALPTEGALQQVAALTNTCHEFYVLAFQGPRPDPIVDGTRGGQEIRPSAIGSLDPTARRYLLRRAAKASVARRQFAIVEHGVDDPVFLGLRRREDLVPIRVVPYLLSGAP